jgi:hypothetical protein
VHLLGLVHHLLSDLLSTQLPSGPRARCRLWRERVGRLSTHPLAARLRTKPSALGASRQGPEFTDRSYARLFELTRTIRDFGWVASADPSHRYSYIESADRIYQEPAP